MFWGQFGNTFSSESSSPSFFATLHWMHAISDLAGLWEPGCPGECISQMNNQLAASPGWTLTDLENIFLTAWGEDWTSIFSVLFTLLISPLQRMNHHYNSYFKYSCCFPMLLAGNQAADISVFWWKPVEVSLKMCDCQAMPRKDATLWQRRKIRVPCFYKLKKRLQSCT